MGRVHAQSVGGPVEGYPNGSSQKVLGDVGRCLCPDLAIAVAEHGD
jgi:hypothetical protein